MSHIPLWVFLFARKTNFYLQILDIINDTTKDKNITVSSLRNRILKIWDTLFELMQIETQWNKNYFIFFVTCSWSFGKEDWLGTRKVTPKINKKYLKKIFLEIFDLLPIPSKRQLFIKRVVILYYTGSNFLTLKVATYLKGKLNFFSAAILTGISKWTSFGQNEHLFYRAPPVDCICMIETMILNEVDPRSGLHDEVW